MWNIVLAIPVLWVINLIKSNVEDKDRSAHCECMNANYSLRERLAMFSDVVERFVLVDPNVWSVSYSAHAVGRILGWIVGRPYVRVYLDQWFVEWADRNMHAKSCASFPRPWCRCERRPSNARAR